MSDAPEKKTTLEVPEVSGEEVTEATELVEGLTEKYKMSAKDTDIMFNAMVAIYIRNRIIYGDEGPKTCSSACSVGEHNN